ncbi:MAG: polyphosphate polymerase domain-containing protein [Campylobacterota bacterium]|nr:polyphosphate polymerase domain-containing protein [Campylobacterota bacterium]
MNNLQVNRNELKYYISNIEYHAMVNKLIHILKPDGYSTPRQGYFIRSLYFDSHDDECLYEKQSGDIFRAKYRMRIYDLKSETVKFEIKNKANNQIFKETATITKQSAKKIIAGDYQELLTYNNPILNKIFRKFTTRNYTPKVIMDYTRDAFSFDFFNLRITFDKNLHSCNTDFDIFSDNLHTLPVILEGKQILEIKYETALPEYIHRTLQLDSAERMAISKYTLGRRFFKVEQWEDN